MKARTLGHAPGSQAERDWHAALVRVIDAGRGHVCDVCGLEQIGHAPESRWLGYERHPWTPAKATPEQLERARALGYAAYAARTDLD